MGSGGGSMSPRPPGAAAATVGIIVEKLQAATGRVDRLSSPVLRAGGGKNAYFGSGGGGSVSDVESGGKQQQQQWWQHQQQQDGGGGGGMTRVHVVAAQLPPSNLDVELLQLPSLPVIRTPLDASPSPQAAHWERLQAVRSPTQQLLSRENSSGSLGGTRLGGGMLDAALEEAAGGGDGDGGGGRASLRRQQQQQHEAATTILWDGLGREGPGQGKGAALLRR